MRSLLCFLLFFAVTAHAQEPPTEPAEKNAKVFLNLAHTGEIGALAFSPDGTLLATGGMNDSYVKFWDYKTGTLLRVLEGHRAGITSLAFSPDGTLLVSAAGQTLPNRADPEIRVWDVQSDELRGKLKGAEVGVLCIAFSADGKRVAAGNLNKGIKIWDTTSGNLLTTLNGHENAVLGVAFSPDGKTLASVSHDKTVRLWDTGNFQLRQTFKAFDEIAWGVAFSDDGSLLAAAGDRKIVLWNMPDGQPRGTLAHKQYTMSVAFLPGSHTLACGGRDEREGVIIWDAESGKRQREIKNTLRPVAFSPDGKYLATGHLRGVQIIDEQDNPKLLPNAREIRALAVSLDNRLLASAGDDTVVRVWDTQSGQLLYALTGHEDIVRSLAFSREGLLASGSRDETIRLWDGATGQFLRAFETHSNVADGPRSGVTSLDFSPDGKTLISGHENNAVNLWDVNTGKVKRTLLGHSGAIIAVAFSPDGQAVATAGKDKKTILSNAETGSRLGRFEGVARDVLGLKFFHGGDWLAEAGTDYVRVWDAQNGKLLRTLNSYRAGVKDMGFFGDGDFIVLAAATFDGVRLMKSSNGEILGQSPDDVMATNAVAVFPSGKLMASAGRDGLVRLWDISQRYKLRSVATFYGLPPRLEDADDLPTKANSSDYVSFTPDGFFMANKGAESLIFVREGAAWLNFAQAKARFAQPDRIAAALKVP